MGKTNTKILAPSSSLPPIKRLHSYTASQIHVLLGHLREIYQPEVNGYRNSRRPVKEPHDSGYASEASDSDSSSSSSSTIDALRTDRFERGVAMRWLTGLVARGEEWACEPESETEQEERTRALEAAAAILGACSGTSSGPLMRTFEFPRAEEKEREGGEPIVIHIRDASILSQDHTSVGLQTWGSSCILAGKMVEDPEAYRLPTTTTATTSDNVTERKIRVLELGAGTGVLSMVLSKLLTPAQAEIIATDYHPAVLTNLLANVSGNFGGTLADPAHVPPTVLPLDWRSLHELEPCAHPEAPFDESSFDLIIGADIIYEPEHAEWIRSSVERLLKRDGKSFFYLIMPTRPTHEAETASVPKTFERKAEKEGMEIGILDVSEIERVVGTGRVDEVRYLLYRIGWAGLD